MSALTFFGPGTLGFVFLVENWPAASPGGSTYVPLGNGGPGHE